VIGRAAARLSGAPAAAAVHGGRRAAAPAPGAALACFAR
jgi:hypothetical protein